MNALDALLAAPAAARLDPFVLALARAADGFDLSPEVVWLAAEVAAWPADLAVDERRALVLAVVASWAAVRQGSTRITVDAPSLTETFDALVTRARQASALPLAGGAHWARALGALLASGRAAELVGARGEVKPLIHDAPHLYLHRSLVLEERFAAAVAALVSGYDANDAGPSELDALALDHDAEQRAAILRAAGPGLSVITGGPGSGKTSIIVSVLRLLAQRGVAPAQVALVAPTGKAAQRMRAAIESALQRLPPGAAVEAVRAFAPPATLHRLLGYSPSLERFRHHENNRLPQAHVIVDEASMVDLAMAERLVRSLAPGASLVLIGDDRQLPAVDAGQPLRDLVTAARTVPALAGCCVALTHSYRMDAGHEHGAAILAAAERVRSGQLPEAAARADAAAVAFAGVEMVDGAALDGLLDRWFARFFAEPKFRSLARREWHQRADGFPPEETADLERLFAHLESFRVLCYTHAYAEGTEAINAAFHQAVLADAEFERGPDFYPGEPVVMLANDYERGVFNGDTGVVLRVRHEGGDQHFMLVFRRPGGFAAFQIGSMRENLRHAFALTVHKAQGSEHDHVLLVLPAEDFPMNTRELVYTALTRARRSVTLAGAPAVLARGAARAVVRDSGVPERLAAVLRPGPRPA